MAAHTKLLQSSLQTLAANKMRSLLTVLGIIIGIASVIVLLHISKSVQAYIVDSISKVGPSVVTILPGKLSMNGAGFNTNLGPKDLTTKDVDAIAKLDLPEIKAVSAYNSTVLTVAGDNGKLDNVIVVGAYGDYWEIRNITALAGELPSENQLSTTQSNCVLGLDIASQLFSTPQDAIGQEVRIGKRKYKVVAVADKQGAVGPFSHDEEVYIPMAIMNRQVLNKNQVTMISVMAHDANQVNELKPQLVSALLDFRNIENVAEADFTIQDTGEFLRTVNDISLVLTIMIMAIASIALIVGGLGIMNIMLVSVTERTQEIGLYKALGANSNYILRQFIYESVIITLTGGVIGTILGLVLYAVAVGLFNLLDFPLKLNYDLGYILIAFVTSALFGIVFGIFPARKAAALSPVLAMKSI